MRYIKAFLSGSCAFMFKNAQEYEQFCNITKTIGYNVSAMIDASILKTVDKFYILFKENGSCVTDNKEYVVKNCEAIIPWNLVNQGEIYDEYKDSLEDKDNYYPYDEYDEDYFEEEEEEEEDYLNDEEGYEYHFDIYDFLKGL